MWSPDSLAADCMPVKAYPTYCHYVSAVEPQLKLEQDWAPQTSSGIPPCISGGIWHQVLLAFYSRTFWAAIIKTKKRGAMVRICHAQWACDKIQTQAARGSPLWNFHGWTSWCWTEGPCYHPNTPPSLSASAWFGPGRACGRGSAAEKPCAFSASFC